MLKRNGYRAAGVKRHFSCGHLKHRYAEGIYIAFFVDISSSCLLRRKIMHRAHGIDVGGVCICRSRSCDSKVRNLHCSVNRNKYILGLYIPVHNMVLMRVGKRRGYLHSHAERCESVKGSLLFYCLFKRLSVNIFHYYVIDPSVLADIVYSYNVMMRKACGRAGLRTEFCQKIIVFRIFILKDLNRYKSAQSHVPCLVGNGHSSCAKLFYDLISFADNSTLFQHY